MRLALRFVLMIVVLAGVAGPFALTRGALAQQGANVVVTAGISSAITLKVCDTTADFGDGLTALGGTPTHSQDQIMKSTRGDRALSQGTIYIWFPSCSPGEQFIEVEATLQWALHACASENSGSSSLAVAKGDLGWGYVDRSNGTPSYADAEGYPQFNPTCQNSITGAANGLHQYSYSYLLHVDVDDRVGTFRSTTTWMAVT